MDLWSSSFLRWLRVRVWIGRAISENGTKRLCDERCELPSSPCQDILSAMLETEAATGKPKARDSGPGPAPASWILLRGLGREHRHWFGFDAALGRALNARALVVDLPGFGAARFERVPTSVPATAEVVLHRLRRRFDAGSGRLGVFGLSLGGMVGLELCRQEPAWFSHAVVLNSSSSLSPPWQRLSPEGALLVSRSLLSRNAEARERWIYELTLCARRGSASEFAARAARFGDRVRRRDVVRQLLAASTFLPRAITQPALVLCGGRDRLVAPACSATLARALGASYRRCPDAGHDLPLDAEAWVTDQLARWLATTTVRGGETLRTRSPATLASSVRDEEGSPSR